MDGTLFADSGSAVVSGSDRGKSTNGVRVGADVKTEQADNTKVTKLSTTIKRPNINNLHKLSFISCISWIVHLVGVSVIRQVHYFFIVPEYKLLRLVIYFGFVCQFHSSYQEMIYVHSPCPRRSLRLCHHHRRPKRWRYCQTDHHSWLM